MRPDETDYLHLEELYGIYNGRKRLRKLNDSQLLNAKSPTSKSSSAAAAAALPSSSSSSSSIDLQNQPYKDGRLLYKSEKKEIYEQDLPGGGRKITTVLLAV